MYNILLRIRKKRLKKIDKSLLTMIRIAMYLWKLYVSYQVYILEIKREIFINVISRNIYFV